MLQGLPLGGLDLFGNRLFFFRLFVGLSCYLTLHPTARAVSCSGVTYSFAT